MQEEEDIDAEAEDNGSEEDDNGGEGEDNGVVCEPCLRRSTAMLVFTNVGLQLLQVQALEKASFTILIQSTLIPM